MSPLVVRTTLQLGASLTDDSRSVIYDRNMFLIQATDLNELIAEDHFETHLNYNYIQFVQVIILQ
jgi:hypothetical protein